jgi:hypothetical protein
MQLTWQGDVGIFVAIDGGADIVTEQLNVTLAPKDAIIFEAGDPKEFAATSPHGETDLFVIEIWYR